ncbi:uncharacterized protein LOC119525783 [Choloepus didactylus]|uniref:uncharacterized protein LOC119525783 n=1 Tax=Choloepus didactylus TaxID=27675 RepID=UPI0018A06075|nr:uncharacterized protein LOC119525783 [Choloepus didactylus]
MVRDYASFGLLSSLLELEPFTRGVAVLLPVARKTTHRGGCPSNTLAVKVVPCYLFDYHKHITFSVWGCESSSEIPPRTIEMAILWVSPVPQNSLCTYVSQGQEDPDARKYEDLVVPDTKFALLQEGQDNNSLVLSGEATQVAPQTYFLHFRSTRISRFFQLLDARVTNLGNKNTIAPKSVSLHYLPDANMFRATIKIMGNVLLQDSLWVQLHICTSGNPSEIILHKASIPQSSSSQGGHFIPLFLEKKKVVKPGESTTLRVTACFHLGQRKSGKTPALFIAGLEQNQTTIVQPTVWLPNIRLHVTVTNNSPKLLILRKDTPVAAAVPLYYTDRDTPSEQTPTHGLVSCDLDLMKLVWETAIIETGEGGMIFYPMHINLRELNTRDEPMDH